MVCNLTLGVFSVSPMCTVKIKNGKVSSPIRKINQFFDWLDGPVRLAPISVGDIRDSSEKWLTHEKGIEIYPMFSVYPSKNHQYEISPVIGDQKIVIVSLAPETEVEPNDILNFWNWGVFSGGWLAVLALLILGFLLGAKFPHRIKFRYLYDIIWDAVKLFLQRIFPNVDSRPFNILSLTIALFVLFFMAMVSCYISTDLVVQKKPFTIDKLEDVLDPRADEYSPLWRKYSDIHKMFSESSSPIKQKIWEKAVKIGIDKCMVNDDYWNVAFFSTSSVRPSVGFSFHMLARAFRDLHCVGLEVGSKTKVPTGKEIVGTKLIGLPIRLRNDSCTRVKKSYIEKRFSSMLEANVVNEIFYDSSSKDVAKLLTNSGQDWRCLGHKDPFERPNWLQITTSNTEWFFVFYLLSLALSLIVFLCETSVHKFNLRW